MISKIRLPGLRGETLLGFLAALGTLRIIAQSTPSAKLAWAESGSGWTAELHVPAERFSDASAVAEGVFAALSDDEGKHSVLEWSEFLEKQFTDKRNFFRTAAEGFLAGKDEDFAAVFTTQLPVMQGDSFEHFDHPFRAARKDYYLGNLRTVLQNTKLEHIIRTVERPWDYQDAMANQSLRLDHGDDRRHAYQWHAPTEDPARQKTGCMLGANRLAIEAFPLFPCIATSFGSTAVGFICQSKTFTSVSWPIWTTPCLLSVVASLLNIIEIQKSEPRISLLRPMGIVAVLRSRRLPIEKNKVFLPPEFVAL